MPALASDLVITGVVDGPLSGGLPKVIELCVLSDVADLSAYGVGSANNGGGSDGEEFTFPAGPVSAGTFLYVASEASGFASFFGFAPTFTSGAASINGDDAIELFMSGGVVDVFGDINVDGTGQAWEYLDGWAYRDDGTGPDGSSFVLANWSFSGPNALDGETNNATAATPFPIGAYSACELPVPVPDLLLSEIVVTPTAGEFVEILNPTGAAIDLSDVYLTDATFAGGGTFYYNIVIGANAGGGGFSDFHARFPDGATIAPGEFQTVSLAGSDDFFTTYGFDPTYELFEDGVGADGIPDMREALPGSISGQGGLSNSGEVVILYTWDGASDLVQDIDYGLWGDAVEAVDKTGVSVDGPDADAIASSYLADTPIAIQDVIIGGSHASGDSFQRIDFTEGVEIQSGGNGVTGSDETSEDLSVTWSLAAATPSAAPAADWVINEIHADPASGSAGDANGDGTRDFSDDEFVEVVNNSGGAIDISGWTLSDGFGVRHTFPADSVIPDQCGFVVFGGGTPSGSFGNMTVQTASTGALGLNNSGDDITLNDGSSDVVMASYGSEGGDNQSLTLDPDVSGALPYVKHSVATGSGGALFSPGTRIDGATFSGCPTAWVINEIHADPASGSPGDANGDGTRNFSDDEFVEIVNNSGGDVDISGWTLADGFSVRHTFPADSVVLEGCSVVVFGGGTPTGAFGNSLVQTASGGSLGLNNSGDDITLNDGSSDQATTSYGSAGGDNQSLTLDPDVTGALPYVKHSVATGSGGALFSPGTRIAGSQFSGCVVDAKIHEVQGNGAASPLVGFTIAVEGIVVGDFQDGSSGVHGDLNGFFVQEEDIDADGDALTSEGIFVFDGSSPSTNVVLGDLVRVVGQVSEFEGLTEITSFSGVTVTSSGNPLPTATIMTLPVSSVSDFEAFESMLVTFPQALVISEYFNFDRFGEIVLTSGRLVQPTAVFEPGSTDTSDLADLNSRSRITLDDGRTSQNPDPAIHPNGAEFDLANLFRGGDTVQDATGVLDFSFGLYRIQPTQGANYTSVNPRTAVPDAVGGGLRIASFNVLNYFSTLDDSGPICGPSVALDCRGADNATEFTRQRDKIIAAITATGADVVGLIEIENHATDDAVIDLIDGLNVVSGAGTWDYVDTGVIGTDAIKVALIYKPAMVSETGSFAILDSTVDPLFIDTRNRPALAQTFVDNFTGGVFTLVVNHLKSKGSPCDDLGDPDLDDGAGNCNLTRKAAAQAEVDWLATDPTGSNDADFLVIGDLNSYDKEDPIDVFTAAGYTDLTAIFGGEFAYGFVFDGQTGYLDYALASPSLFTQITGVTDWHINADEPDLIDYDTTFKQPNQDAIYAPDAYRSSDHDPVIGGVDPLLHDFDGFFQPVDNVPALNSVKAGSSIPIRFSLNGDHGLDIIVAGYPRSQEITCDLSPVGGSEATVSADDIGLTYDAESDQYNYVWKSSKAWADTCRQFVVQLNDGVSHYANFKFK